MSKLCSLKEITPGSVVVVPKDSAAFEGERAIVFGLEYEGKDQIRGALLRRSVEDKELVERVLPKNSDEYQLEVTEDEVFKKAVVGAFIKHKLSVPDHGMSMGCDPEIFVVHGDGSVFPAWEYMPTEEEALAQAKLDRAKVWMQPELNYAAASVANSNGRTWDNVTFHSTPQRVPAYWDGAQAEFAPYAKNCLEALHGGTRSGLIQVLEYARAKDPNARLTLQNVVELPTDVLTKADDKYIQFRCSQSYNIYNDPGAKVQDARQYKFRCSGGHIHFGLTRSLTAPGIEQIVRGLDGILGIIGVSLADGIDNPERRRTYGRAGEFRLPSHGIEYRVLSNFWLTHPAITMLVFDIARASLRFAESGLFNLCWNSREEETRGVINDCDVEGARRILRRNAANLVGLLRAAWPVSSLSRTAMDCTKMRTLALKAILNGVGAVIADPTDIEKNWVLGDPKNWKPYCQSGSWKNLATSKE